jgi:hypothetical protein
MARSDVKKEATFFISKIRAKRKSTVCRYENPGFAETITRRQLWIVAIRISTLTNIHREK